MTHDFAKKPKPTRKKKQGIKKTIVPGWVWMFTGIVTGIFLCFLAYLADITPSANTSASKHSKINTNTIKKNISDTAKAINKKIVPDSKTNTTRFDFYTLLPEREMIVPTEREDSTEIKEQALSYILQAGSFKNDSDADRLRAKLLLMGLKAKVEEVSVKNGERWHRVQVGPFNSRSKLAKARNTLINEGIDTLLLKRKTTD